MRISQRSARSAAASAMAVVSLPPRPSVVMSKPSEAPWKSATARSPASARARTRLATP